MAADFLIIGNPENRRVAGFQSALEQRGLPPARILAYADILTGRVQVAEHLRPGTILRIESPGENFQVEKELLRKGIADAEAEQVPVLSERQIARTEFDLGRILHPRQAYLGFRKLLRELAEHIARVPGVSVMNAPGDIEMLFDKRLCHERCEQHGIPVPPALGTAACFDELIARMEQADEERVFIKLANGSSASGVVAFLKNRRQSLAMTSAEIVREAGSLRLYNSLKVRSYTRPRDQADLIDALCREQVHIERWLPKAVLDRYGNFDLRIVVIGRKARHWVVRQSRGPLTNLHLGNRRGNREEFLNRIGPESWNKLQQTCEKAMQAFPGSLYAGVDLLVLPDYRDHRVLELNAFGDLLPGVLSQGADTYTAEIEAAVRCVESY